MRWQKAWRVLSVFHNRRWDSDFLTLKGLLAEGVLGEIAYVESHLTASARRCAIVGVNRAAQAAVSGTI